MQASELIEQLKKLIEKHGDLKVIKTGVIGSENYEGDIDADCIEVKIEKTYFNVLNGKFETVERIEL